MRSPGEPTEDERRRLWGAADAAASVREHLLARKPLEASDFSATQTPSPRVPVLREIERTLGLLPHAFGGAGQAAMDLPPTVEEKTKRTLPWVEDAFTNREHLKFSLKGTLPPMTWDLINLSDPRFQMSMAIARDRVVGIALGLLCT